MWMKKAVIGFVVALLSSPLALTQQPQHFQRGLLALQQNHLQQALEEFTLAERAHPSDARIHNFSGIVLAQLGRHEEAAAEYQRAIRLDPKLAEAYRNLGLLEWTQGQTHRAQNTFSTALRLDPGDSYAHFYLGRVELQEGKFREALHHLEESKLPWPDDADFLLQVAAGYAQLGQREKVLKTVAKLEGMRLLPAQTVSLGSVLAAMHENERLLTLFERLEREHAGAYWAEFDLALAEQISGHSREAAARAASVAAQCGCWEASSLAGIAEARLGQQELSISGFREAASLDPHQEERWLDLTRALMEAQGYGQAIDAAEEGLRNNPRSYLLHLRLGAAYLSGGRYRQAEDVFRDLIAHDDPLPTSTVGLAQVLLRTGRMKEAAAAVAKAQKRIGDDFLLAYFRGIALDRSGKPDEAILSFEDALRFNPHNPEALRWLGEVELETGHASAAIEQLTEALKLNPSDSQARLLLARGYRMARNPQAAAAIARELKPAALPTPGDDESRDFFMPPWQMPPSERAKAHESAIRAGQNR